MRIRIWTFREKTSENVDRVEDASVIRRMDENESGGAQNGMKVGEAPMIIQPQGWG